MVREIRDLEGTVVTDPYLVGYWGRYHGLAIDHFALETAREAWLECDRELAEERASGSVCEARDG